MWRLCPRRSASDVVREGFPQRWPLQLPKLEVEPFEHRVVPLAQIDELDNAHDIQGLHEKEAGQNGYDFVVHGRGKATTRAVSMIVASMPLPPASIVIAKPVVTSRRMRP